MADAYTLARWRASQAALERLAAALDPGDYVTALTTGPGRRTYLSVTSRHAQFGADVWADHRAYYRSWGRPASQAWPGHHRHPAARAIAPARPGGGLRRPWPRGVPRPLVSRPGSCSGI